MNTSIKQLLFVCQAQDSEAVAQLGLLQREGYNIQTLVNGEFAPVGSIAMYTGHNEQWPSKYYRVAAHRLYENRPEWAVTTPFLVSLRPKLIASPGGLYHATLDLAQMYMRWFLGDAGVILPWETRNGRSTTYRDLMESWMDLVETALGEDELAKIIAAQSRKTKHSGSGGDVVFSHLLKTGHVALKPQDIPCELPGNKTYAQLTPFKHKPVVSYGTSDLANVFELLQALKLGYVLKLPVAFETYPGAHDLAYWLNGFLNPSLKILGATVWSSDLGLEGKSKYTEGVTKKAMGGFIKSARLENIGETLISWADNPIWLIYHKAMRKVADMFLSALQIKVDYELTTTEMIAQTCGLWEMKAKELATAVKEAAGHEVVLFNKPNGTQVKTGNNLPELTVGQLHELGWWLGGAAIYYTVFNLSTQGGLVVMVKDSTTGGVNLMARQFMEREGNLYVTPVGLFRLSATEQNEDWSVDPLVMLSLMESWGPEKTADVAETIWNNMEVPLQKEHIGQKTVARVSAEGVIARTQSL